MRKPLSTLPRKGNAPKLGSSSTSKDNEYLYTAGIRDGSNRIAEYRVSYLAELFGATIDLLDRQRCVPYLPYRPAIQ